MGTRPGSNAGADLRDYLAEERTFLAWIRTGLAVMALGFVVARFGPAAQPDQLSRWFGTALIAAGVAVNLVSTRRHTRLVAKLNHGQFVDHGPSKEGVILAVFLASVGTVMAVYLLR
jgi:putative membrane protein